MAGTTVEWLAQAMREQLDLSQDDAVRAAALAVAVFRDQLAELADMRALFELQWDRSVEAQARWRAEDPQARALVLPDLGVLLRWLMDDADRARAGTSGPREYRRSGPRPIRSGKATLTVETPRGSGGVYFLIGVIDHPQPEQALDGFFRLLEGQLGQRIDSGMAERRP